MKICVVSYKFGTSQEIGQHLGVYNYFVTQLKVLAQQMEKLQVVAPWLTFFKKGSVQIDNLEIVRTYPKTLNSWKWFLIRILFKQFYIQTTCKKLLTLYNKEKFDLVYVWQGQESCVAALDFKQRTKVPVIFHQIGPWHWHLEKLNQPGLKNFIKRIIADAKGQQKYISRIYNEADKIISPSQAFKQELLNQNQTLKANDIEVVPLAVDHQIFRPGLAVDELRTKLNLPRTKASRRQPGAIEVNPAPRFGAWVKSKRTKTQGYGRQPMVRGLHNQKVLIFIGRIIFHEKGLDYLLAAIKLLKNQGQQDFKLIIIGHGKASEVNKLKEQINKLDLNNLVSYLGTIPNDDLPAYLNLADISLVPSVWFEILGRVNIEALACATPVICFDIGGMKEVNLDNQTGLVVPVKDSTALAQAIQKLLTDDELRKNFGQAGRQQVEQHYSYQAVADQFINIFKKVLDH